MLGDSLHQAGLITVLDRRGGRVESDKLVATSGVTVFQRARVITSAYTTLAGSGQVASDCKMRSPKMNERPLSGSGRAELMSDSCPSFTLRLD